ncbi:hypothetical protein [Aestuariivivens sp. NBU2969]|uniref:hypothetical protein n=1 Tax=Aestuariivivens sp. NBU2969 TaxID=2873267 RepID=UPI001CC0EC1F|nr:hypothetical protein [Aestuariivivens sp. NBU2969]
MKTLFYLFLSFPLSLVSQETIATTLIKKTKLEIETFVGIDNFKSTYYIQNNVFYKNSALKTISYNNLQLGNLTSIYIFNPLKINLFYKDFNTVIILDNRLAEIFKIDFNTVSEYRNVTHVSTGHDNTLWLFNQDTQQLELYDYKANYTKAKTLPVQTETLDLKSNYNTCWLLTKEYLYVYNYFGSLLAKMKNNGYTQLSENNNNLYLKKENSLFYLKQGKGTPAPIETSNLLINQFFATNETLYIYDSKFLYEYHLKLK